MAKIARKDQKIFCSSNPSDIGQFGSGAAGTKVTSDDLDTLQNLAAFLNGWRSATISAQKLPPLQEFNSLSYIVTRQVAYLLQEGIAEYSSGTEYHQNSIVKKSGTYQLFGSKTNTNTGNALTDTTNWEELLNLDPTQQLLASNYIINPDFEIWNEGTSFTSIADSTYFAENWEYFKTGSMVHDVSISTDVPTVAEAGRKIPSSVLIDCTTADAAIGAGDYCFIAQKIEGYNFNGIAQREFSVGFWVKATKTGVYCAAVRNSGIDRSYVSEITINSADTWEYKTIKVAASPSGGTWNYTNGVGLELAISLAVGSNFHTTADSWQTGAFNSTVNQVNACDNAANNFRICGVQINEGARITKFSVRSLAQEIMLTQRYFETTYNYNVAVGTVTESGEIRAVAQATNNFTGVAFQFKVRKRTTPSMTAYSPGTGTAGKAYNRSTASDVNVSMTPIGEWGSGFNTSSVSVAFGHNINIQAVADARL